MNEVIILMIAIAFIIGLVIFYLGLQVYSELHWRLEKYGKNARVPYFMKRSYVMNRRRTRQLHANERQIILRRLYRSINKHLS